MSTIIAPFSFPKLTLPFFHNTMALPFSNRVGSGLQREYIRDEAVRLFKKNKDVDTEEGTVVKMLSILTVSDPNRRDGDCKPNVHRYHM